MPGAGNRTVGQQEPLREELGVTLPKDALELEYQSTGSDQCPEEN